MFARILAAFSLLPWSIPPVAAENGPAPAGTLAVYLKGGFQNTPAVRSSLTKELNRLMSGTAYRVHWPERPKDVPGTLVIVTALGDCSPHADGEAAEGYALASTQETDGRILPFVSVNCSELNGLLAPALEEGTAGRDAKYGRALARVLAHEFFHILAQTHHHADSGVAQRSVSGQSLLSPGFEFDEETKDALRAVQRIAGRTPAASVTGF